MVDSILEELKNTLQQRLYILKEKQKQLLDEINEYINLSNSIRSFLNNYTKTGEVDFNLLENSKIILSDLGFLDEKVNYKELQIIRDDMVKNDCFFEEVSSINNIFATLINKLKSFSNSYVNEYKQKVRQKYEVESLIGNINEIFRIISKIENDEIIYEKDFLILDEMLQELKEEERAKLYTYIIINNADIFQKKIKLEKEKKAKERLKRIRKKRTKEITEIISETEEENIEVSDVLETSNEKSYQLTDEEQDLVKKAQCIIDENDMPDDDFLKVMVGLNYYQMLDYIDDTKNPEQSIAMILSKEILPKIYDGTIKNIKEILELYISKYNKIIQEKSISSRLLRLDKKYILDTIIEAENIIKYYELHKDDPNFVYALGYYSVLKNHLIDLKCSIEDDELIDMIDESYILVLDDINEFKKLVNNESDKSDDLQKAYDFYKGASNLIVFPDGINFSEQIDDDPSLNFSHKQKILKGLETLSKDTGILSSSRHKVKKIGDNESYKKLRSYRSTDYRIVYRVSEAKGLEKLYNKKINVVFPIKVFYGATDNKDSAYADATKLYDTTVDEIENLIEVLNSDDIDMILEIVDKQMNLIKQYIDSCDQNYDVSSGMGVKGGSENE